LRPQIANKHRLIKQIDNTATGVKDLVVMWHIGPTIDLLAKGQTKGVAEMKGDGGHMHLLENQLRFQNVCRTNSILTSTWWVRPSAAPPKVKGNHPDITPKLRKASLRAFI